MSDVTCDGLKLENQICFPLYAASREMIKLYRPYLDALDLTYTQYIAMMALWEKNSMTVKELGDILYQFREYAQNAADRFENLDAECAQRILNSF